MIVVIICVTVCFICSLITGIILGRPRRVMSQFDWIYYMDGKVKCLECKGSEGHHEETCTHYHKGVITLESGIKVCLSCGHVEGHPHGKKCWKAGKFMGMTNVVE